LAEDVEPKAALSPAGLECQNPPPDTGEAKR